MAKKKIVWVEDDPQIISAFRPHFDRHSWTLFSAASAEQGKILIQTEKPEKHPRLLLFSFLLFTFHFEP